ncbi:MAG: DUF6088 family protein [Bacillota bacterium]|nr:DUF6088 family protein [Bacillota bacterium]
MSSGPYKKFSFDNTKIEFKHRSNKEIAGMSLKSAMVIQALRALGKNGINTTTIQKLQNILSAEEKATLRKETQQTTAWICYICKRLTTLRGGLSMNKNDTRLAEWAVNKVETDFRDDVCLLLEHRTLKLEKDMETKTFSFYIPATNRANGLARTFIIDGIGHDLFPMSWERIERMADVKDYNTTCLADAEILWAKSDEDRQRFVSLQARLQANLQNPQYMLERAKKWFNTVTEIYQDTLFEERLYKVRENAGYICDLLSIAVAFVNGRYFTHGQTNQLRELSNMRKIPVDFAKLYEAIIRESSPDVQKRLCYEMITNTRVLLDAQEKPFIKSDNPDFSELAAWYQELIYTWRRVYHWCDTNDPVNVYIWCCFLQNEVDEWGTKFGIIDTDIIGYFKADDLSSFRKRAETVEAKFQQAISTNDVKLDEYKTVEDFLKAN